MVYSMDEIYELFMWDNSLSLEENEAKAQLGIAAAMKLKNLHPFLQPILAAPQNSKMVWEPCARVLAMHSDDALKPHLFRMLEWLQDTNWPGADIIFDRLACMPYSLLDTPLQHSRKAAEQTNDAAWLSALDDLYDNLKNTNHL